VLAAGLALFLALAPAGAPARHATPPRRPAVAKLTPENAVRAKRGLLPRRSAGLARTLRSKRLYRPAGPTWVPEPIGPGSELAVAEADAGPDVNAVAYPRFAAAIHGVEVRWMVIRHDPR
jgi:hypothetical protein